MQCFLCEFKKSEKDNFKEVTENVKKFSKLMLENCRKFKNAREYHRHKYKQAELPESVDDGAKKHLGYHSSCYKEFMVKKQFLVNERNEDSTSNTINSFESHVNEGVKPNVDDINSAQSESSRNDTCFFCDKVKIKRRGSTFFCSSCKDYKVFLNTLSTHATELGDTTFLQKIQRIKEDINPNVDCLTYHRHCKLEYFSKYQSKVNKPERNDWALKRDIHAISRLRLLSYVKAEVIKNKRMLPIVHLKNCLHEYLEELYQSVNFDVTTLCTSAVKDMLQKNLKSEIKFINIAGKAFVTSFDMNVDQISDEEIENMLYENEAVTFALKSRKHILKIKKPIARLNQ